MKHEEPTKLISVVIVTYNSETDIFDCLNSVYRFNDIGEELEVIVVDNNSLGQAEMFDRIGRDYPKVICLSNTRNSGYGSGNNIGIRHSHAPFILIMNPDVRHVEPVFGKALKAFENPRVVIYGMKQKCFDGITDGASFFWRLTSNSLVGTLLAWMIFRPLDWYIQSRMYISGSCFFVRKDDFEKAGMFDENIFLYAEEDDIRMRLLELGNKRRIIYDKSVHYLHRFENRVPTLSKLQALFASRCYLCAKHGISARTVRRWEIQYYRFVLFRQRCQRRQKFSSYSVYREWINELLHM